MKKSSVSSPPPLWSPLQSPSNHQRYLVMSRCEECIKSPFCSCRCSWCQDPICAACRQGAIPKLHRDVMPTVSEEDNAKMPILCLSCDTEYYKMECKCVQCHRSYDEPCIENPQMCNICKVPCCASCIASGTKSVGYNDEACYKMIVCSNCESTLDDGNKRYGYHRRLVLTAESVLPKRAYGSVRSLIDGAVDCEDSGDE